MSADNPDVSRVVIVKIPHANQLCFHGEAWSPAVGKTDNNGLCFVCGAQTFDMVPVEKKLERTKQHSSDL